MSVKSELSTYGALRTWCKTVNLASQETAYLAVFLCLSFVKEIFLEYLSGRFFELTIQGDRVHEVASSSY